MNYQQLDNQSKIWHPFTQHGLNEPIVKIVKAQNEFLYSNNGEKIVDGISSWWVNTFGHSNKKIISAIKKQSESLQQVIFAGFTHNTAEEAAAKICEFLPPLLEYVFFSDSGSTSVEVALKMAVGFFHNKGIKNKTKIVAFEKSYHGDTFGGMSSGGRGVFNKAYNNMLFDVIHIPYPQKGKEEKTIVEFNNIIKKNSNEIAAIIIEPLILGSGGMLMYPSFVINELYNIAKKNNIFFILDEVMTGFGRTGTMFAFEQTDIVPDIICLSKGLTGGNLPLAMTIATKEIYDAFYSKNKSDMFFHSSSYTANPIACAAANANLKIWKKGNILEKIKKINKYHLGKLEIFKNNKNIKNARVLGSIFAFDFIVEEEGYLSDIAVELYKFYLDRGILLRPLGNTVYVMPPYCISQKSLDRIYDTIEESIEYIKALS